MNNIRILFVSAAAALHHRYECFSPGKLRNFLRFIILFRVQTGFFS